MRYIVSSRSPKNKTDQRAKENSLFTNDGQIFLNTLYTSSEGSGHISCLIAEVESPFHTYSPSIGRPSTMFPFKKPV